MSADTSDRSGALIEQTGGVATEHVERMTDRVWTRRNAAVAATLFVVAIGVLVALDGWMHIAIFRHSPSDYFNYQAESFLHGRWDLDVPGSWTDIVTLQGKHYIVYPPFPAVLLVPFVAIFGLGFSDVLFTLVLSAINLSLLFLLFEQLRANRLTRHSWMANALFSLFFYFGSISLWLSLDGKMWFTAAIVCWTFTLLSLIAAFRGHYAWSAALLGCAFFSRATVLLGYPFLFYLAWEDAGHQPLLGRFLRSLRARVPDWQALPWRRLVSAAAVTVAVGLLFVWRNTIIFGSPLESGYNVLIHQRYPMVTHGAFNVRYVPANIIANFFTFPHILFTSPYDRHPAIDMMSGGYAISVFVTTPLFVLLFFTRNRAFSTLRAALWATVGLIVVMVLLFHAAGWVQFGARYLFEGYPYAFLLLVLSEIRLDWRFVTLGLLGILVNVLGAHQFWTGHIIEV
jgi:hypothetical protein